MNKTSRIYLDYAASTPVDPAVLKAMAPYFTEKFGNPGSLHSFGQEAMGALDKARETVAKAIGCSPAGGFRNIIFTGSATEANNLALRGVIRKYYRTFHGTAPKIIISGIEHESILDTARDLGKDACLRRQGVEVVYLPVNENGIVDLKKLESSLDERTVLVSVMYVNNEIGSVQPIAKISEIIRNFREELRIKNKESNKTYSKFIIHNSLFPLLHTDAAQALNYFDCDVKKLGVDLMTLSGQKIYGPKGIGALFIRNNESGIRNNEERKDSIIHNSKFLIPVITGGGQEFGLRSGTENIPAIVGFGKAMELATKNRSKNMKEVNLLKNEFWRGLKKIYPQAEINGKSGAPHILNIHFPTEFAGDLLIKLDIAGIAVSAGSACSARSYAPSPVLHALGLSQERVRGSLRFSFGKPCKMGEIKEALKRMRKILV